MTLTIEHDLDSDKVNQHANYLRQKLSSRHTDNQAIAVHDHYSDR